MGRVKLKFPDENPLFTTAIPIRVGDLNYGNHVGNDSILSIIHEARMQFLHRNGHIETDIAGIGLIMADVMIAYRGESFYGDVLTVRLYADELTAHSFDLLYHLSATRDNKQIDIAHAKTGMVCFDYKDRKITAMTEVLKNLLEKNK